MLSQIEALTDGATASLDYRGNDVWASGLVGWKLAAADHDATPFAGNPAAGARHPWPRQAAGLSAELRRVVEGMTELDPTQRLSADQAYMQLCGCPEFAA